MLKIKQFIKKYLIPKWLLKSVRPFYHGLISILASLYFGRPSSQLVVIGVTGTAGKSTTVQMLAKILNSSGKKCGFITTVSFSDGEQEHINKHGLSMPGGWLLHHQLWQMYTHRCEYAVVEATSEGLAQNRHFGISLDMAIFTNLSKAHLDSHGGFENYKKAKGKLFQALGKRDKKLEKTIVVNLDDENVDYFLSFKAEKKVGVSLKGKNNDQVTKVYSAVENEKGFELEGENFEVKLFGKFNSQNAVVAAAAANVLGVSLKDCARALSTFTRIRGRMESVENKKGFFIFVDYGCEPATMKAALLAVKNLRHKKIIHVFGSTGGHRDMGKRFEFGKISAQIADIIIITNDDVYESDPEKIASDIAEGIKQAESSKQKAVSYEIVLERRQAIRRALEIAQPGDVVLITGKGSEQFLVLPGEKRIIWDDVSVVKEELQKISNN